MSWLDVGLVGCALSFAVVGYRQGFVAGVLAFGGFLGGAAFGLLVVPGLVAGITPGLGQSLLAVGLVLLSATVGQVTLGWVGSLLRARLHWRPVRVLDNTLGAAVSVLAVLVVAWFLASVLRPGPLPALSRQIGDSRVVAGIDQVLPDRARTLFSEFRRIMTDAAVPPVFSGLAPERIRPVTPPERAVVDTLAVRRAAAAVVKVAGDAPDCNRTLDGSGFVVSARHVLTNAHVVAGVAAPRVQVGGTGDRLAARVVVFDPRRDLAVLYVPDLRAAVLALDDSAGRGDSAVVAGFPGGGRYRVVAARVRDEINARGPDIYQRSTVTRQVFSLYADVEPGNSGGPLLSPRGRVYGVVFAKSLDDPNTGYALTVEEAKPVIRAGRSATARVTTGPCA